MLRYLTLSCSLVLLLLLPPTYPPPASTSSHASANAFFLCVSPAAAISPCKVACLARLAASRRRWASIFRPRYRLFSSCSLLTRSSESSRKGEGVDEEVEVVSCCFYSSILTSLGED
jgi:hypothetical protein